MWNKAFLLSFLMGISLGSVLDINKNCTFTAIGISCVNLEFEDPSEVEIFTGEFNSPVQMFELQASNAQKTPKNIFKIFGGVEHLLLDRNEIRELTQSDLEGGGNLKMCRVTFNEITKLPADLFKFAPNVEQLFLAFNKISEIDETALAGLSKLKNLDLTGNSLKVLSPNAFNDLVHLKVIFLHRNRLEALENGIFKNCQALEKIILSKNQIKKIGPEVFAPIGHLQDLDVSDNFFPEIYTSSVDVLNVNNCTLKKLHINGSVEVLLAHNNHLEEFSLTNSSSLINLEIHGTADFDWSFLENASRLEKFALGIWKFSPEDAGKLSNLQKVTLLDLSNLNLEEIPDGLFEKLTKITDLSLSQNKIKSFDLKKLSPLVELEHLEVEGNEISEFDYENLKATFPKLKYVNLDENKFQCSYLARVFAYLKENSIKHVILMKKGIYKDSPDETDLTCIKIFE